MAETIEQYRNRINQLKTSIENEPYIKEMREDIAEGISKTGNRQADIEIRQDTLETDFVAVQQDARSNAPSGAELAVAAGEYNTLGERLDAEEQKVTAQLAKTGVETIPDLTKVISGNGKNVVITGDSLSFNYYDFASVNPVNAYEAFPGMLSWSFMLRDAIHRNDTWFKNAEELGLQTTSTHAKKIEINPYANKYELAFNGIYASHTAALPTDELTFNFKHLNPSNKAVIYFMGNPSNHGGTCDIYVDNSLVLSGVSTKRSVSEWKGFSIIPIEIPLNGDGTSHVIKMTNFTSETTFFRTYLFGAGSKKTNVHLTGRGSWRSSDILTDIQNRILQYSPDVLMMIIGANDIFKSVSLEAFKTNLLDIINQTRVVNKNSEVILLTTTPMYNPENPNDTTSPYVPMSKVEPYIEIMKEVCLETDSKLIDVTKVFEHVPVSEWRFDNVHMTKYGNAILFDNVVSKIMPNSVHDKRLSNPTLSLVNGIKYTEVTR